MSFNTFEKNISRSIAFSFGSFKDFLSNLKTQINISRQYPDTWNIIKHDVFKLSKRYTITFEIKYPNIYFISLIIKKIKNISSLEIFLSKIKDLLKRVKSEYNFKPKSIYSSKLLKYNKFYDFTKKYKSIENILKLYSESLNYNIKINIFINQTDSLDGDKEILIWDENNIINKEGMTFLSNVYLSSSIYTLSKDTSIY